MLKILALALILTSLRSFGAAVYVDNAATGSNNGTSWANAFTNYPTSAQIAPGDTVYISGGTNSKTYSSTLTFVESGTSSNWITYRVGQDAGHNGVATFPAISFENFRFIDVNAARSASFSNPTSVWDIDSITNNTGFRTTRTNGLGVYFNAAAGADNKIRWVEVGPHGTSNNIGDIHGITFNNLTTISNLLIEYCWVHDIQNDGVNQDSADNPEYFNAITIRWCIFERTGDDGVQWSRNGLNLNHCFLRDHWYPLYNGHPDQLQLAGRSMRYLQVWNNIFRNKANSLIIAEHFAEEGGLIGPMIISGNIFYNTRDWIWNDIQAYGATFSAWRENTNVSAVSAVWTNLYVVNNTIYGQHDTPFKIGRSDPSGSTRSVWDLRLYGAFRNNLLVDNKNENPNTFSSLSLAGDGDWNPGLTNQVGYTTSEFPASHNVVAGTNRTMTYHGVQGTNAAVHGMNNVSTMPMVETNTYTFTLLTNDTVAKDMGFSLTTLAATYPEILTDLAGNARGQGSGWDIGALEYVASSMNSGGPITNGLLVGINFDVAPANDDSGYDDWSGNGNHGRHLGHMASHTASNRCPDQIQWTNRFTLSVQTGGKFRRYYDGWDEYQNSGDYLAITNNPSTNELWSMRAATIMCFARYDTPATNHPDYTNTWNAEGNRRLIGAGYGYPGAWTLGLPSDGGPRSAFRVYPNTSATASYGYFNDRVNIVQGSPTIGSSTNMRFYLVTWTNGFCQGWLDGVLQFTKTFTNSSGINVSNLTIRGPSGQRNGMLMIGGDTHNANPLLTYLNTNGVLRGDDGDGTFFEVTGAKQVPNHGWGGFCTIDNVRIYNRVLSTNEWLSIMMETEGTGSGSGPTNPPASSSGITITTASLNVRSNATINQVTSP